jgi:hypothetical protein
VSDRLAFPFDETAHRSPEVRVRQVMSGMRDHRLIAPRQLVLALRARLYRPQSIRDRPFDRLVIAQLEVKERHLLVAPPIAAVKRIRPDEIERPRDRLPPAHGEQQQHRLAHRLAQPVEEAARQIRLPPFPAPGVLIEAPHRRPLRAPDLAPAQSNKLQPLASARPLLADDLALAARKRVQEIIERAIAAIEPVILNPLANQPVARFELADFLLGDEGRVRRA